MFQRVKAFVKRPEIIVTAVSTVFTLIVSSIVGFGGLLLFNNFLGTFFITLGGQFVLFFILNTFLQKKDDAEATKLATEQLNALSKYVVMLTCSYCSKSNPVPIILNQENRFKCESCQQTNGVKMQFHSTQITIPLEKVVLPGNVDFSVKG